MSAGFLRVVGVNHREYAQAAVSVKGRANRGADQSGQVTRAHESIAVQVKIESSKSSRRVNFGMRNREAVSNVAGITDPENFCNAFLWRVG